MDKNERGKEETNKEIQTEVYTSSVTLLQWEKECSQQSRRG